MTAVALRPAPLDRFQSAPAGEDWFALESWQDGSVDHLLCDDPASWPPPAVEERLRRLLLLLRPGGVARFATENLARAVESYLLGTEGADGLTPAQRFNAWRDRTRGRFLYDEPELTAALKRAGFVEIARFLPGASAHALFWDLPDEPGTLILEARRPVAVG